MSAAPADRDPVAGAVPSATDALPGLLGRSARGDETAFAELYDATARRVHGLVLRVCRNPAIAQEVTQEVYLEIWRQSARYSAERGSALAWMLTIAHRKAVDRVRSVEAADRRDSADAARTVARPFDETAERVESRLDAQRVHRALGSLTEVQRQAVELAYLGGYTHTEVARLLDLPLGTAKTRIRDGLIRLRDTMGVSS